MQWVVLIIAGLFRNLLGRRALKLSEGFTRLVPSLLTIGGMIVSFGLLSYALKSLPLSVGLCGVDRHRHCGSGRLWASSC